MKNVFGVGLLTLALTACGGGGDNSSSSNSEGDNQPVANVEINGVYTGKTNQAQNVIGLVDKNNK
ncbi:MAG: hypothetical protein ACN6NI_05730, partial [Acinetobacter sp.]